MSREDMIAICSGNYAGLKANEKSIRDYAANVIGYVFADRAALTTVAYHVVSWWTPRTFD